MESGVGDMMDRGVGDMHAHEVTTLLKRRWRLIATIALLGGVLVGTVAFLMPPRYTAKAQLLQETEYRDGVPVSDEAAVDTLVELLLSPGQLQKLAANLSGMQAESGLPLPGYHDLQDHLSVFRESHSRLVAITYVSTDPHLAALVVNRAVDDYMAGASVQLQSEQTAAVASVAERLATARQNLDRAVANLNAFRLSHGTMKADSPDDFNAQIGLLTQQLAIARAELAAKEALLKNSAASISTQVQIATAGSDFAVGSEPSGNDASGSAAAATMQTGTQQLTRERDEAKARLADIEARLDMLRTAAAAAEEQRVRLRELERDAAVADEVFQSLTRREVDMVSRGVGSLPARVVTMATVPSLPSSPNPFLFLLPAIVGAALIGSMVALVLERTDRRLRSEWDVEAALELPCIGLVPKRQGRLGKGPFDILPPDPFSPYVEGMRAITVAANKHMGTGELPHSFLFTGSADGDGATTLAVSFALYAARLNQRVLLMDLNFRRPGVAAALGEPELSDPVDDPKRQAAKSGVRRIKSLGIDYLPPPQRHHGDPLAVLLADDFSALMARVVRDYDCVVIDSAPVANATETRLLSLLVDRILFVVKWGATDARAARSAIRGLRAREGHAPISVVVAQADMHLHERNRYGQVTAASEPAKPSMVSEATEIGTAPTAVQPSPAPKVVRPSAA